MTAEQNSNVTAVRDFYAALNAGDIAAMLKLFDKQVVRIEFEGTPSSGAFRGLAEMEAHLSVNRARWAEGNCEPERLMAAGDKVVALVHVRVRLKEAAEWNEGDVGDVFTFSDGKISEMRTFAGTDEALRWAGV